MQGHMLPPEAANLALLPAEAGFLLPLPVCFRSEITFYSNFLRPRFLRRARDPAPASQPACSAEPMAPKGSRTGPLYDEEHLRPVAAGSGWRPEHRLVRLRALLTIIKFEAHLLGSNTVFERALLVEVGAEMVEFEDGFGTGSMDRKHGPPDRKHAGSGSGSETGSGSAVTLVQWRSKPGGPLFWRVPGGPNSNFDQSTAC